MSEDHVREILYHETLLVWTFVKNMPSPLFHVLLIPHLLVTLGILLKESLAGRGAAGLAGLWDGLKGLKPILRERRNVQRTRRALVLSIAKAMTWSPIKMIRKRHDVRPVKIPPQTEQPQ